MTNNGKTAIGIDVGGVIIDRVNDGSDTSFFGANYLSTTAVPYVFDSIARLSKAGFTIYVVSKCGEHVQKKTCTWLRHHNFQRITGVPENRWYFCESRKDKAEICRNLGITHFVDDRLEVLSYLETVPHKYLFNPQEKEVRKFKYALALVEQFDSWPTLVSRVLENANCVKPSA